MKRFRPGVSFSDFVVTDMSDRRDKRLNEKPAWDFRRGMVIWIGCMVALFFLWVRLLGLQVFGYQRYKTLADENRLRLVNLSAPRGIIYDRNGKVLAENESIFVSESDVSVQGFRRVYPEKESVVHAVGYLGEAVGKELGLLTDNGQYKPGDLIGRTGLEGFYEDRLKGKDGGWLLEIDSLGKIIRDLGKTLPVAGEDLKTTLSSDLSRVAQEALGDKKGAAVVSDPRNGEILALVSSPGFDPNQIVENFEKLNTDSDLPLFNRAVSGVYPPGSVYKMLVSIAAMDSGKVKPEYTVVDNGLIQIGTYRYTNWLYTKNGGVEGSVGFARAITRSVDTFFYRIGEMVGPETLEVFSRKFGLGEKTGIDIWGEEKGLVPSPAWKKTFKNENWYLGNSFLLAIGQDDLLTTPLQINSMTNILATGGKKCKPHLEKNSMSNVQCPMIEISEVALDMVKKGMIGACSNGGTAFVFFDWNEAASAKVKTGSWVTLNDSALPIIACKTGTAEFVGENGKMRTHGWLTAFAPANDPEISVTVLMEGGGEGSSVAAPVVRKILAKYFNAEDRYPYNRIPVEVGE